MLQDDRTKSAIRESELAPLLVLCLATAILSVVGSLSLVKLFSTYAEIAIDSGVLWVLGSVLFLLALVVMIAIWKYFQLAASLNNKEKGLRRDIQLLEGFFDKNPSMMWVKNMEGSYNLVNQGFREFTGSKDTPVERIDFSKIFVNANATLMADQEKQVVKFRSPMEFEAVWETADGLKHYSILRFPLLNERGDVFAIGGIANDRTDQVNARRALRESEKQFRSLVESAADAILIANDRGEILLANKQAERIFLLSRSQLMKSNLQNLLPQLDIESIPKPHSKKLPLNNEKVNEQNLISMLALDSEGKSIPVEAAVSAIETESGVTNTCIVRDISDRVKLETQLRESQKMDAIGKLTGGMAHDFNNLLGVIMGNIDLALRKVEQDSPIVKRLETAKKAGARGAELTQRMLAVARRQPLMPKPNSIKAIVEELSDMLPRTLGPDIEMSYDMKSSVPNVLVDRSGLENVILNLAINSAHAMPDGGKFSIKSKVLHLTQANPLVEQEKMNPGMYVQISITDTGTGMTQETLSRAFEPFFSTKERDKGTGLGLAMVYGFAKQSGGSVQISSEVGNGTTIDIFLPAAKELQEETPQRSRPSSGLHKEASGKVLIVDDECDLLEVTASYVKELGFSVIPATDGNLALKLLEQNPDIEFLLTDIVMPGGINGVSLAKQVRERLPNIKILYMSGFPSGVIADKSGIELDAPLITKPFSFEELVSAMDELICEVAA
ncbi:MAG: PAS domain S-box protein [Gammaproteobacteria bacterium]|nr:PAS domain S-box protein [Gammaproteobacteria bacterium]